MGDDYDEQVLKNVRKTAGRSKKLVGELHNLKAKIYSLENDIRHMGWKAWTREENFPLSCQVLFPASHLDTISSSI